MTAPLRTQIVPRIAAVARSLATPERARCASAGVEHVDLHGAWPGCPQVCRQFLLPDGVHTTEEGAAAVARAVASRLLQCPAPALHRRWRRLHLRPDMRT